MLNHNQTAIVLVIGLVAVLMTSASTRVFAQPTSPASQIGELHKRQLLAEELAEKQAVIQKQIHAEALQH
jgi:hypothetical protein